MSISFIISIITSHYCIIDSDIIQPTFRAIWTQKNGKKKLHLTSKNLKLMESILFHLLYSLLVVESSPASHRSCASAPACRFRPLGIRKEAEPPKSEWWKVPRNGTKRNGLKSFVLLMEEILHQLIGSLSHYLHSFLHPRWCRISSITSRTLFNLTLDQSTFLPKCS